MTEVDVSNILLKETHEHIIHLSNLPDAEFNKFFLLNPEFIHTDIVYERRCRRVFAPRLIPYRREMPWREFYYRITDLLPKLNSDIGNRLCRYNKIMELYIVIEIYGFFPDVNGANQLAEHGQLSVLEYLEKYSIYPNTKGANAAAENAELLVLDWLKNRNILPTNYAIITAIQAGNTAFLNWYGTLPEDINACEIAIMNNNVVSLEYLFNNWYSLPQNYIELAIQYQAHAVLHWFAAQIPAHTSTSITSETTQN